MKATLVLVALAKLESARAGDVAQWITTQAATKCHRTTVWRKLRELAHAGLVSSCADPFSSDPMPEVVWSLTDTGKEVAEQRRKLLRKAVN